MNKTKRFLTVCALAACTLIPAGQAFASDTSTSVGDHNLGSSNIISPMSCGEVGKVKVSAQILSKHLHKPFGTIFRSGPGGVVKATTVKTYSNSVSSNVSSSIGVSEIVTATIQAGVSTSVQKTQETAHSFERPISSNTKYGNLQYGDSGGHSWKIRCLVCVKRWIL